MAQRVELQNAHSRQRTHVVWPQQVHQGMRQFRQLVIELLAQPPGEKCEPFEQAFDIRVLAALAEEWRKRGAALGKALAELPQRGQFTLVVMAERDRKSVCSGLQTWK